MDDGEANGKQDAFLARLLLEEVICDICRFQHAAEAGADQTQLRIRQEVDLGTGDSFADIVVDRPSGGRYIVEIDYGYSPDEVYDSVARKYGGKAMRPEGVDSLHVVVPHLAREDWEPLSERMASVLPEAWRLKIWDEAHLRNLIMEHFGVELDSLLPEHIFHLRKTVDHAKGQLAFGDQYGNDPLDTFLLWRFGYWRLRSLFEARQRVKTDILQTGTYQDVAVVFADLAGFSSYVRDTRHSKTVEECLGAFCTKSRYQILNHGGMLYQYLGDAVIGVFGMPEQDGDYVERAFDCARSLLEIGESVSREWQSRIDRVQASRGSHIGLALGDLQIFSLRPYSRVNLGAVGETINLAARLSSHAAPGQIACSNRVHRSLSPQTRKLFAGPGTLDARNIGQVTTWVHDTR